MWAQDLVPGHYRNHQADLLITLMDAWVLSPEMLTGQGMNVAHWMPVDCSPLSVLDRKVLAEGKGRPVAMSEFGRRQLEDAGHSPLLVPHAVDTAVFAPLPNREPVRDEMGLAGLFAIGIIGRQPTQFETHIAGWFVPPGRRRRRFGIANHHRRHSSSALPPPRACRGREK